MSVSRTVSNIFSVKEYRDLKTAFESQITFGCDFGEMTDTGRAMLSPSASRFLRFIIYAPICACVSSILAS